MGSDEPEQYRKLFIGGLSRKTTYNSLKHFFEQWGYIEDVVVMKDSLSKRPLGYGFITYSQSAMVDQAMLNRPHIIDGRQVESKRAVLRQDIDKPDITATVKKMYVSGITNQSENDLVECFGKFGNIINVSIITDKNSDERKGYGFIEYDDTDSVDKAVLIKTHEVGGGVLDAKKSISGMNDVIGKHTGQGSAGYSYRKNLGGNHFRNDQWGDVGYNNKSNGGGAGYGNFRMGGDYGSGGWNGGGGYGGSAGGYNSYFGRLWQGSSGGYVPQSWGNRNYAWGIQGSVGNGWGNYQQQSNHCYNCNCYNWGANQNYGGRGGGPMRSNYTTNNRSAPYGNPEAGKVNAGNGQNPGQQY